MSVVDFERRLEGGRGVEIWVMEWCSTTMSAVDFERRLEGGRGVEIWLMECFN